VAVSTGSDDEFADFMRGRWPAMVRLAYALSGDAGHAEDIAQAAFARAYAAWGRVSRAGDPDAYVRRIVLNENRKRFRKHRVPEDLHGDLSGPLAGQPGQPPGVSQQGPEERQALLDALGRLGPRQRAVIVLRYWLDLSEAETAAALNCSVGTVKSQASRGLATLRKSAAAPDAGRGDSGHTADTVEGGRL
jgi:RNA polymerase sigma-70 factor (sigma-E family)